MKSFIALIVVVFSFVLVGCDSQSDPATNEVRQNLSFYHWTNCVNYSDGSSAYLDWSFDDLNSTATTLVTEYDNMSCFGSVVDAYEYQDFFMISDITEDANGWSFVIELVPTDVGHSLFYRLDLSGDVLAASQAASRSSDVPVYADHAFYERTYQ